MFSRDAAVVKYKDSVFCGGSGREEGDEATRPGD